MNETMLTVVGNAATRVESWTTGEGGSVARFRLAATVRRRDRESGAWTDGPTSFYTVWARRALAANLTASVAVGEPLVVHGRLRVRETEHQGQRRVSADIDATAVGHDLSRGTSAFRRGARPQRDTAVPPPAEVPAPAEVPTPARQPAEARQPVEGDAVLSQPAAGLTAAAPAP
ncbi:MULTISPECIES: single-stranded DNA-binding protein [Streptomyces]|uniref:Single-stranded DNA-binding protein n=1 Tax=Streptomyces lycii TaxID=2654337 RepID=A0ABQ7FNZ2_9ACTN|nr:MULTISPECIES: single-stranded DNA-binding protein [Streptomyces]KAF4408937.1 single-stranded DNA-binding protein [Streptomyces lycii]PGH50343.1 single-stranded DNA-binding protein [Streptomyces sp. Ru87]